MSIEPDIELTVDEDIVLWHSISRGDKKAFDDFFMKYYTLLYGYSRYYVSAEDANEVLQELMMWLWENRCSLMEELTLTTPSILFSAISLIMLAYTNRFLAYAQVIRNLKGEHENRPSAMTKLQLDNLRKRLYMARSMQIYGVISLLLCVVCTFFIYIGLQTLAIYTFGVALLLLVISLGISVKEILISVKALEFRLDNVEAEKESEKQK